MSALSLTPMLCSQLLRLQKKQTKLFTLFSPVENALDKLDGGYAKMLNWAVRHRAIVILGCIAFFVLSLFSMKNIGAGFPGSGQCPHCRESGAACRGTQKSWPNNLPRN